MKFIPDCFTDNDCVECFNILEARVFKSTLQPKVLINFIPLSKYQFTIEIDFGGPFVSSAFTLIVEINKNLP